MSTNYGSINEAGNAVSVADDDFSSSKSSSFAKFSFLAKIAGAFVVAVLVVSNMSSGNQENAMASTWFLSDLKEDLLRTDSPTLSLTGSPTSSPTGTPTATPTLSPTVSPTSSPTATPIATPTSSPTDTPTATPTSSPTASPTSSPTATPTATPTSSPTATPTSKPTSTPTLKPTSTPTATPTSKPTSTLATCPANKPTVRKIGGKTYASCEGTYKISRDLYNGVPIWDRTDGSRFAFFRADGSWSITGSQWRAGFVGKNGNGGGFVVALNKSPDFQDAVFPGEQVQIVGKTYASCEGTYSPTKDLYNGKPIWNRSDGQRFAFVNSNCVWAITGSQWRAGFVGKKGSAGAFVVSQKATQSFTDAWFPGQTRRIP